MNNKNILVVGELNMDIILNHINSFPVLGQEILANDMNLVIGSSSAIFAANIATLGVDTFFCGMVGDDFFGKFILDELKRKNVDTTYIKESKEHKTGATIVLNYSQDRANITYCGAMERFCADYIPHEKLSEFRHLHLSSYFLQKELKADIPNLFKAAKEQGLTTSLDIQWDPENSWEFDYKRCLPFVDIFLPNESEILLLTGKSQLQEALDTIGEYSHKIIVKRGGRGSVFYEKGKLIYAESFLHDQFVDAIGAGDSFNAGFISKYLGGFSIEDCLQFANLAGAINTTGSGGTAAFESFISFKRKAKELFNVII